MTDLENSVNQIDVYLTIAKSTQKEIKIEFCFGIELINILDINNYLRHKASGL